MLDMTDTLGPKIRVVEKGHHAGESHIPLTEEVEDNVVLHVNVPSATPASILLDDGLSSLVMCEDLDRQVRLVVELLKKIFSAP